MVTGHCNVNQSFEWVAEGFPRILGCAGKKKLSGPIVVSLLVPGKSVCQENIQ